VRRSAWEEWAAETRRKGRCEVCGEAPAPGDRLEGHHVLPQQKIKRIVGSVSLERLTDLRNHLACCKRCHDGHTSRLRPIPRHVLSATAFEFAAELGLTWHVEKSYPEVA
jgi:hypothetical protein